MAGLIWITGGAGCGKTTLASELKSRLPHAIVLDGEHWRAALGELGTGYAADDRLRIGGALARLALLLTEQNATVIVATISRHAHIGTLLARRAFVVRVTADAVVVRERRPTLDSELLAAMNADPWPFPVDLTLRSDERSPSQLAEHVLKAWR